MRLPKPQVRSVSSCPSTTAEPPVGRPCPMTSLGRSPSVLAAAPSSASPRSCRPRRVRGSRPRRDGLRGFVDRSVRDRRIMLVVAAYLVGFVLHAVVDLAVPALPGPGAGGDVAAVTALASHRAARSAQRAGWVAVGVVTLGLVLLSPRAPAPPARSDDHPLRGRALGRRRRARRGLRLRPPPGRPRSSGCSPVSGTPAPPSPSAGHRHAARRPVVVVAALAVPVLRPGRVLALLARLTARPSRRPRRR